MKENKPTLLEQFRKMGEIYTGKRPIQWGAFAIRFILMWAAVYGFEWLVFGNAIFTKPYLVLFAAFTIAMTAPGLAVIAVRRYRWLKAHSAR